MAAEFKPGDLIKCLRSDGGAFTLGEIYKVISTNGSRVRVEADDDGDMNGWEASYFELVTNSTRVLRKELLVSALPEGGFLVTEPSRAPYDVNQHVAAFSQLADALEFIRGTMS